MNGYTKCPGCLNSVRVVKGLIAWHKGFERLQIDPADGEPKHIRLTCTAHKQPALWVESGQGAALNAFGRNPQGVCMKCGLTETNPDCHQCSYEKRHK